MIHTTTARPGALFRAGRSVSPRVRPFPAPRRPGPRAGVRSASPYPPAGRTASVRRTPVPPCPGTAHADKSRRGTVLSAFPTYSDGASRRSAGPSVLTFRFRACPHTSAALPEGHLSIRHRQALPGRWTLPQNAFAVPSGGERAVLLPPAFAIGRRRRELRGAVSRRPPCRKSVFPSSPAAPPEPASCAFGPCVPGRSRRYFSL